MHHLRGRRRSSSAGVVAAKTQLPVLGVPMRPVPRGMDSLLPWYRLPRGIPVATFAIGEAGAGNAARFGCDAESR